MPDGGGADAKSISGRVGRILHFEKSSGFSIFVLERRHGTCRALGVLPQIRDGLELDLRGVWEEHPKYGPQFRAETIAIAGAGDAEALAGYLAACGVPGVGRKTAERLVERFGARALSEIENGADLAAVKGLGGAKAEALRQAVRADAGRREVDLALRRLGLTDRRRDRAIAVFGPEAARIAEEDPWRLSRSVPGFGWKDAEAAAVRAGIASDDVRRIRGALWEALASASAEGHCGLERGLLVARAARLLGCAEDAASAELDAALRDGLLAAGAVEGRVCVFQAGLAEMEATVAVGVLARASGRLLPDAAAASRVAEREAAGGLRLTDAQRAAVAGMLTRRCAILTGGPGVGKSTSTRVLVEALQAAVGEVRLAAPTGRAAKRLAEAAGRDAETIHRLLEAGERGFARNAEKPLECKALVLDETSMMDVPLTAAVLEALSEDCALYLIGDADQLPSVGPGRVLADLIESGAVAIFRLTEILRQEARDSRIVACAHAINAGSDGLAVPAGPDSDLFLVPAEGEEETADLVVDLVARRLPAHLGIHAREIQVLSPMRRGAAGIEALNRAIRERINPAPRDSVTISGRTLGIGDKVIQTANDYELDVRNGDVGVLREISRDDRGAFDGLLVAFEDGRRVAYDSGQCRDLEPAHALTVHKAQGSEFPVVVIPLARAHRRMLRRNLLYTAVTRGKRLVVLVGARDLVGVAAASAEESRRTSRLRDLLAARAAAA